MKNRNKRDGILAAALEIIAERGFHGSPMAMIAQKAEVASGTIYVYFKSKDELIDQLLGEIELVLRQAIEKGYPADGSIRQRFFHIGASAFDYFLSHPLQFRFLQQYYNSPFGAALRRDRMSRPDSRDLVRDFFHQGIAEGILKDIPLIIHTSTAFGPIFSIMRDHVHGLIELDNESVNKVLESCWDAIKK